MSDDTPPVLWEPDAETVARARITAFSDWVRRERGVEVGSYDELWSWSTRDLEGFWGAVAEFHEVRFHERPSRVLDGGGMPGAAWFPGSTLNYAEHALHPRSGGGDADLALIAVREDGRRETFTYAELRAAVAAARSGLVALGVGHGDRVAALAPNSSHTLVAFLAAASLGAVWSSCSPDFGTRAVVDRFAQIEPTVLVTVDGYLYNGKRYPILDTVAELRAELPTLVATVVVGYLDPSLDAAAVPAGAHGDRTVSWTEFTADPASGPEFVPVDFDHPLWILYSSGTTGRPKAIVHGHGGIVVEHLKSLSLQHDLGPGDRFLWFTTTGWMMWNLLVSGLLVGSAVVAFDGSPSHPDLDVLWRMAADEGVTLFGTSASFVQSCLKEGLRPADHDLSALEAVGSTGSAMSAEGFDWIHDAVGAGIQIASVSGGTDVCTAFVSAAPTVPVWRGEMSCRALGAAVEAYSPTGESLHDEVGELVITRPMPSMPVKLWNDPDGSALRDAYFEDFPGVWRHGDWIRITPRGSCVIEGRSDSTLNRGGVRMGTAEFYEVVEAFDEVTDSLVIDTSGTGTSDDGELLCFVVLTGGVALSDLEPRLRSALREQLSPRHVPDRFLDVADVPRTLNAKKSEVPVKRILAGTPVEDAVSPGALSNPEALQDVVDRARCAPRS